MSKFYPTYYVEKVEDIKVSFLEKERIKAVIFDLDNTLVDFKYRHSKKLKEYLKELKKNEIKVCVLTNSYKENKIKEVCKELSIKYISKAFKPSSKGFEKALQLLDEKKDNTVIVGDQIFTDIYGGNKFGIRTVLVKPVNKREAFVTLYKRPFEKFILSRYKKHIGKKEEVK